MTEHLVSYLSRPCHFGTLITTPATWREQTAAATTTTTTTTVTAAGTTVAATTRPTTSTATGAADGTTTTAITFTLYSLSIPYPHPAQNEENRDLLDLSLLKCKQNSTETASVPAQTILIREHTDADEE